MAGPQARLLQPALDREDHRLRDGAPRADGGGGHRLAECSPDSPPGSRAKDAPIPRPQRAPLRDRSRSTPLPRRTRGPNVRSDPRTTGMTGPKVPQRDPLISPWQVGGSGVQVLLRRPAHARAAGDPADPPSGSATDSARALAW